MLGPGQVGLPPSRTPGAVAGHRLGQGGPEPVDQRPDPAGGVGDQAAADPRFDPLELLVDRGQRRGDLAERVDVSGADRAVDAANHRPHQLDDRGEEDLAGVLAGPGPLEEAIDLHGLDGPLQQGAEHDGDGGVLEESFEGFPEEQSGRPCVNVVIRSRAGSSDLQPE